jgi:hypothetical protein
VGERRPAGLFLPRRVFGFAFCALTVAARVTDAQANPSGSAPVFGVIDGLVTDGDLHPLDAATISILQSSARLETGSTGRFRFARVPGGEYLVIVRKLGFHPVSGVFQVAPGDTLRLTFTLERVTLSLDTMVVTEHRLSMNEAGFEMRRRAGVGQFITQEQIERHGSIYVSDLLRAAHGVNVAPIAGVHGGYVAVNSRSPVWDIRAANSGGCYYKVYVDGVVLPAGTDLDLLPPPRTISGIEVYDGAFVPPQYAGPDSQCGVILVWTKDGG